MDELHPILRARPGMYMPNYNGHRTAACFCSAFLTAMVRCPDVHCSGPIDIMVAGPHFVFTAACALDTKPHDRPAILRVFDGGQFYPEIVAEVSWGIAVLAPIVWYAESCVVTLPGVDSPYRQAYWHGRPIGNPDGKRVSSATADLLSFSLTIPPQGFETPLLDRAQLQEAFAAWRIWARSDEFTIGQVYPRLRWQWRVQDPYHYSLRVVQQTTSDHAP